MPSSPISCERFREQLEAYFAPNLDVVDPVQEFRMDEHSKECLACGQIFRESGEVYSRPEPAVRLLKLIFRGPEHLAISTLREHAASRLSEEELEIVNDHFSKCSRCAVLRAHLAEFPAES